MPQTEGLEIDALGEYLRGKIEGAEHGVKVERFPGGHSNLTYLLRIGGRDYVLRRAPVGPVAPKAHDMAREYTLLKMIHPHFPEAPQVYHLCEDASVLGAIFYLMERRRGIILRDQIPPELAAIPNYQRRVSEAFIDCLVRLHAVDIRATGLIALGKPEGYVERQLSGWTDRWNRAKTEEIPEMDRVIGWLRERVPPSLAPTLIHNDYKLDNVVLPFESPDRIEAVLDWEMTTVGDPLSDLGLTLCYWTWAASADWQASGVPDIPSRAGWYTRDEFVERYANKTGRDLANVGYYEVLGVFKLAIIIQQIYVRFHRGQTNDQRFRTFGDRAGKLVRLAASVMEQYS